MNKQGFAVTGILYTLLLIAVISMNLLLYNLLNRKTLLDRIKTDTVNAVEKDSDFEYLLELINKKADKIEVQEVNKIATNAQTLASNAATKSELQALMNIVNEKITLSEALDKTYPIGSIYMSMNHTNPETLFGGKWEPLKDRFLVGAGNSYSVNSKGGTTTHHHKVPIFKVGLGSPAEDNQILVNWNGFQYGVQTTPEIISGGAKGAIEVSGTSGSTQGYPLYSETVSSMPPYLAVYMWKRIS